MLQEVTHGPRARAEEGTPEESLMEKNMGERTTNWTWNSRYKCLTPTTVVLDLTILHTVKWKNSGKGF